MKYHPDRHLLEKAGVFFYAQIPMTELCQKGIVVPIQVRKGVFAVSLMAELCQSES